VNGKGFRRWAILVAIALLAAACSSLAPPRTSPAESPANGHEWSTSMRLHGKPLELHLSAPRSPEPSRVVVLYASGDGGWFGAAVDMFHQIARAGYYAVGFSSRAFLKIERPHGALVSPAQLADEYVEIVVQARVALGLDPTTRAVLTGWSRGAAFAVLAGSEAASRGGVLGVVAIGLAEDENLGISSTREETDEGQSSPGKNRGAFDTYARIAGLGPLPCAVIQATRDGYLPAARARQLFGPDTPARRFYTIEARNHRFSGGKRAFDAALLDAIRWIVTSDRNQPSQRRILAGCLRRALSPRR